MIRRSVLVCLIFLFSLLLGGCDKKQGVKTLAQKPEVVPVSISGDRMNDVEKMERCRRELDALKKIDLSVYNRRKQEFDKLLSGAVIYNGVRGDVGNYTQRAVDAFYLFRTDKLCSDISKDVLDSLSRVR